MGDFSSMSEVSAASGFFVGIFVGFCLRPAERAGLFVREI